MKGRIIKILKIVLPIALGLYLTWYFISGLSKEDIEKTKTAFLEADFFWIGLSLIVAFLSHFSRAYRWLFALEPLGYKPKLINSYHAVMSGYIINYTIPRSGEVARAGLLASAEGVPFEKGFATIVVERVIDLMMAGIIFLITGWLQADAKELQAISAGNDGESNLIWYILGGGLILGIIGLVVYFKSSKVKSLINEKIKGFWEGLKSIWTMKKKWAYIGHTIFIWTAYVAGIWITAQAFPETKDMPMACVFAAFFLGAAAIGATPGGLGLYPLWITGALALYNIDFPAFGILAWVIQTVLLVVLGLISLFLIQRKIKVGEKTEA